MEVGAATGDSVVLDPGGVIAREVRRGQTIRITDLQGQQVGDLIAFRLDDLRDRFWISNTIRLNGTIYLTRGHVLYSERSHPLLRITADTCGRHDLLAGSCNAEIDKVRYGVDDHRGCVENFMSALAPWGLERHDVPMSLNLFMNCPVSVDGSWSIREPLSRAGDYVEMRAETDLLLALSNCPQDLNPCNSGTLKPLGFAVLDASDPTR